MAGLGSRAGVSGPGAELRILLKVVLNRRLRPCLGRCFGSIFYNFFFCQYRADLARRFNMAGRIPVSTVDHELDGLIPFSPGWVTVYLDFVGLWVRMLGSLLERFGKRSWDAAAGFLDTMADLYRFAAMVYQKNLSTTARPFYIRRFRFLVIHLFDPHLMCIPSLHVMVVILTYTRFRRFLAELGGGEMDRREMDRREMDGGEAAGSLAAEECRRRALDITEAILYVKQHSVNCVAAAMYAMTCFDRAQFPPEEAEDFVSGLFSGGSVCTAALPRIGGEAAEAVRGHILSLYRHFLSQGGDGTEGWEKPLLEFLKQS
ncbi:MAG: hypothetical protein LBF63_02580 [Treponema sp.]|jgi:hypothetical protein|nr:hypothetical protein [Treponema sp.]